MTMNNNNTIQTMTRHKTSIEIYYETKNENRNTLTDEYLYRELAHKLIKDLPFEELSKLIRFTKIDPFTKEGIELMRDPTVDVREKEQMNLLRARGMILYEGEVIIPNVG